MIPEDKREILKQWVANYVRDFLERLWDPSAVVVDQFRATDVRKFAWAPPPSTPRR